ncbi:universal stress protein [Waterburya agarophytonicola K14]|uniref:Universal stress protein n=1 Tax=Waterburya agarophytonicola KI4 TaxID=2874699 RepID=A0A964BZL0_9CYAN|nr:universal stress protein [Waterburya agarophytonicola]MCC0179732.1 universal stress protein [Waterburya agarophytonicola KI4]
MINKIFIAVDRSRHNRFVFDTAVSLAQTTRADLMLLHILSRKEPEHPTVPTYTHYPIVEEINYERYQQEYAKYEQHGIEFLENITKEAMSSTSSAIAAGVSTEFTQLAGNRGRMICELANNWSADLILVGSRGLKGLKEIFLFLGSVSNYVTHHAPCSVLIVRQPVDLKSAQTSIETEKNQLLTSK